MQKLIFSFVIFAALSMSTVVMAQRPGGEGGPRGMRGNRGGPRPVSPLMTALDANKDGKLSAEEIANAVAALKSLDKNEDGVLEASELAPSRGQRGSRGDRSEGSRGEGRGEGGGRDMSAIVDRIMERDENDDQKLTKKEAGERMAQMFDRVDTDKDGFLTRKEVEEMAKSWSRGGSRGGGGGNYRQQPKAKDNRPAFDDDDN